VNPLFDLTGKTALVTGASRGLGENIAWALAGAGAAVAVVSRHGAVCQSVADAIAGTVGRPTLGLGLDVTDEISVVEGISQITETLGSIDILVNNSGTTWGSPLEKMTLEKWHSVMAVNVDGVFLMLRAVLPFMMARHAGRIINIASVAGLRGMPRHIAEAPAYHASKGALVALTKDLAVKYGPYGITANAIAPGFIPTKMSHGVLEHVGAELVERIPAKRMGVPEDVSGLVVFLASGAASYISGQVIAVDGGTSAQWP
jgi:gluconate 5-dehydrogenase